jgi:hypothetical protein
MLTLSTHEIAIAILAIPYRGICLTLSSAFYRRPSFRRPQIKNYIGLDCASAAYSLYLDAGLIDHIYVDCNPSKNIYFFKLLGDTEKIRKTLAAKLLIAPDRKIVIPLLLCKEEGTSREGKITLIEYQRGVPYKAR